MSDVSCQMMSDRCTGPFLDPLVGRPNACTISGSRPLVMAEANALSSAGLTASCGEVAAGTVARRNTPARRPTSARRRNLVRASRSQFSPSLENDFG